MTGGGAWFQDDLTRIIDDIRLDPAIGVFAPGIVVEDVVIHHIETAHRAIVLFAWFSACDVVVFKAHKVSCFVDVGVGINLFDA